MKPHHRNHRQFKDTSRRKSAEATANSVDEAIIKALTELRVPKERARIEVLDPGKPKILGLFGGRPAKVRATLKGGLDATGDDRGRGDRGDRGDRGPRPRGAEPRSGGDRPERPDRPAREAGGRGGRDRDRDRNRDRDRERGGEAREPRPARVSAGGPARAAEVRTNAAEMLKLLGAEPAITAEERAGEVWLTVESSEADGLLIGRRGETLTAMEHLLTRMSSLHDRDRVKVVLDVGGYRSRKGAPRAEGEAGAAEPEMDEFDEPLTGIDPEDDEAVAGAIPAEGDESGEGRRRRRRGRRGRGGRSEGGRDGEGTLETGEPGLGAPRGFAPRGLPVDASEPEMEGPGGALLDESMLEAEPDFEVEEIEEVEEDVVPSAPVAAPLPAHDPEDDFDDAAVFGSRPPRSGDRGGRGGGRDRDRGGRGGGRDRDRGGRSGGRDRDRGDRPDFETTPEIRAAISDSKRLEQELMQRMSQASPGESAVESGAETAAAGPKLPSFRKSTKKRRGYVPPTP
jgi:predicted RNA-binding protein Jag